VEGGEGEPPEPRAERQTRAPEADGPQGEQSRPPWLVPPQPDHHANAHARPGKPVDAAERAVPPGPPEPYVPPQRLRVEVPDVRGDPVQVEVRARSEMVWVRVEGGPEVAQVLRGHAEGLQRALIHHGLSLVGLEVDTAGSRRYKPSEAPPPAPPPRPVRRWEAVRVVEGAVDYVV